MKQHMLNRIISFVLVFVLLVGLLPAGALAANTKDPGFSIEEIPAALSSSELALEPVQDGQQEQLNLNELTDADGNLRVSIVLEQQSTFEKMGFHTEGIAQNTQARTYRASLEQNQAFVEASAAQVLGHQLETVWHLTLAANLISAKVKPEELKLLRNLPGVKRVVVETKYEPCTADYEIAEPNMGTSSPMIGANTAWGAGYTGAGQRIAIIDTGLDTDHQSVDAGAFSYALQENGEDIASLDLLDEQELEQILPQLNIYKGYTNANDDVVGGNSLTASQLYISAKVPFGYNYIDRDLDVTHDNDTQGGHGSHVAGIAAANRYIPEGNGFVAAADSVRSNGVAPDAQLLVMKVFGKAGGAYDSDYMTAIEDAILLGADSINLSLGAPYAGFVTADEWQSIFDNLQNVDAVVTISAGNSGVWPEETAQGYLYSADVNLQTGGSPGTYANSLCVASVDNDGLTGPGFSVGGQSFAYQETQFGNAAFATLDNTGKELEYIFLDSFGSLEDLYSYDLDFDGKILFVSRGELTFAEKWKNAEWMWASALVVYNKVPGGAFGMDLSNASGSIPCISISQSEAEAIREASTEQTASNGTQYHVGSLVILQDPVSVSYNSAYYTMSSFSSWGPTGSLTMKPEITAPGGSILSLNGETAMTDQYMSMSGTSMAAPQVAGLSAVLAQYIKDNNLVEKTGVSQRHLIQSLLMSTAEVMREESSDLPYSILRQGAGLSNVEHAIQAESYVTVAGQDDYKVKAEVGDDPERTGVYTFDFTVHNFTDQNQFYLVAGQTYSQGYHQDTAKPDGKELTYYMDYELRNLDADISFAVDGKVLERNQSDPTAYDFNGDGSVTKADAKTLLDYAVGVRDSIQSQENGDLSGDGKVTAYDVELLLKKLTSGTVAVPANGEATVSVTIALTKEAKESLDTVYPNGTYIEAYIQAEPLADAEGKIAAAHSIPVLAFYGDWESPSMFDHDTRSEVLSGEEKLASYFTGISGKATYGNAVIAQLDKDDADTQIYLGSNPYAVDDAYLEDRNALASCGGIFSCNFSLIRNAGDMRFAVTNAADNSVLDSATAAEVNGGDGRMVGAFYYTNVGAWYNASMYYALDDPCWAIPAEIREGDQLTVTMQAITERKLLEGNGGVNWATVTQPGSCKSISFTIDNTAPKVDRWDLMHKTVDGEEKTYLEVQVTDNRYTAALILTSPKGMTILGRHAVNQTVAGATMTVKMDMTDIWGTTFQLYAIDYAGNMTAYQVTAREPYDGPVAELYGFTNDSPSNWVRFPSDNNMDLETLQAASGLVTSVAYGNGYLFYVVQEDVSTFTLYVTDYPSFDGQQKIASYPYGMPKMAFNTKDNCLYYASRNYIYQVNVITGEKKNIAVATDELGYFCSSLAYSTKDGCYYGVSWFLEDSVTKQYRLALVKIADDGTWTVEHMADLGLHSSVGVSMACNDEAIFILSENSNLYTYSFASQSVEQSGRAPYTPGIFLPVEGEANTISVEKPTSLTVDGPRKESFVGLPVQLTADIKPWCLANKTLTWTSSDEGVATVDENGLVTGLKAGSVTITATSVTDPGVTGTYELLLKDPSDFRISAIGAKEDGSYVMFDYDFKTNTSTEGNAVLDAGKAPLTVGSAKLGTDGSVMVQDLTVNENGEGYRFHLIDPSTGVSSMDSPSTIFCGNVASRALSDFVYLPNMLEMGKDYVIGVTGDSGEYCTTEDSQFSKIEFYTSFSMENCQLVAMAEGETGYTAGFGKWTLIFSLDAGRNRLMAGFLNNGAFGLGTTYAYYNVNGLSNLTFRTDESGRYTDSLVYDSKTKSPVLLHDTGSGYEAYLLCLSWGDGAVGEVTMLRIGAVSGYDNISAYTAAYTGTTTGTTALPELNGEMESVPVLTGQDTATGNLHSLQEVSRDEHNEDPSMVTLTIKAEEAAASGMLRVRLDSNLELVNLSSSVELNSYHQSGNMITFGYAASTELAEGDTLAVLQLRQTENESSATVTETECAGREVNREETISFVQDPCAKGHTLDEGIVTKEPTCTEPGERTCTCTTCGETVVEEIPALGHDYEETTVAPTCEDMGYTKLACTRCGDSYIRSLVPATGHQYKATVTKPTCETAGYTTYTCKTCGHTYVDAVTPELGHSYTVVVTEPTCDKMGYTTHTCTVCGHCYVDAYVQATDHHYEQSVTKEATCTNEGQLTFTCIDCGETYTKAIPILAHNYEASTTAPTCETMGYTTYTCTICGHSYQDDFVNATGHTCESTVVEASCLGYGYTEHHCKDCDYSYISSMVQPLGHDYVATVVDPSLDEGGYTLHVCSRCGESYRDEETAPLGHQCAAFTDIPDTWAKEGICFVIEHGLMQGVSEHQFAPKLAMSRAMLVTVLYRLAGTPTATGESRFSDVTEADYFADAVIWAAENGIVCGVSDTKFAPNAPVTREQTVTLLYRYAVLQGMDVEKTASFSGFADAGAISAYARTPMAWAVANGILYGTSSTTLSPQASARREQIAAILMRFVKLS